MDGFGETEDLAPKCGRSFIDSDFTDKTATDSDDDLKERLQAAKEYVELNSQRDSLVQQQRLPEKRRNEHNEDDQRGEHFCVQCGS